MRNEPNVIDQPRLRLFEHASAISGSSFDYAGIPPAGVTVLRAASSEIRTRIKRQIEAIIATGEQLRTAKELLQGRFVEWIGTELDMSVRTAQNYMRAAEVWGPECATVAHLPPNILYLTAAKSTPDEVRAEIVTAFKGGQLLCAATIEERVREARHKAEEERRTAKIPLEKRKRQAAAKKRREVERQKDWQERERRELADKAEGDRTAAELMRMLSPEAIRVLVRLLHSSWWVIDSAKRALGAAAEA
jgi:hypothetical protein